MITSVFKEIGVVALKATIWIGLAMASLFFLFNAGLIVYIYAADGIILTPSKIIDIAAFNASLVAAISAFNFFIIAAMMLAAGLLSRLWRRIHSNGRPPQ